MITTKIISQIFSEYLNERRKELADSTMAYYEEAIGMFEHCLDGYGHLDLENDEDRDKLDKIHKADIDAEFCKIFSPKVLNYGHFAEYLGYFYPKKVMSGYDTSKKVCGATCHFYKWCIEKDYINSADSNMETRELKEVFEDGWKDFNTKETI